MDISAASGVLDSADARVLLKDQLAKSVQVLDLPMYETIGFEADDILATLATQAKANGGKVELTTVAGGKITVMDDKDGGWLVVDAKGGKSKITIADVNQSNGVIHVIDGVLLPN